MAEFRKRHGATAPPADKPAVTAPAPERHDSVEREAGTPEDKTPSRRAEWKPAPDHAVLARTIRVGPHSRNAVVGLGKTEPAFEGEDLTYGCSAYEGSGLDRMDEYDVSVEVRYHLQGDRRYGECPEGTTFFMETELYLRGVATTPGAEP
jgi:hypothetical protein